MAKKRRVAVFGLGYVGCTTAACLAKLGHHVIGIDVDAAKVEQICKGEAPFHEPGLRELIRSVRTNGHLRVTRKVPTALGIGGEETEFIMVCVGTPLDLRAKEKQNLQALYRVLLSIVGCSSLKKEPATIVIRSTVLPGTCEKHCAPVLKGTPFQNLVMNPEFLREGSAIEDFMYPELIVIGSSDTAVSANVASLYASMPPPKCDFSPKVQPYFLDLRTAEMVKYACNAFHATKIAFANEIGSLCSRMDIPSTQVMDVLCRDRKLNISSAYLRPGFAFGGSCLPKDLSALTHHATDLNLVLPLLMSLLPSNGCHLERAIEKVEKRASKDHHIGIFGATFKESTDDVRESPAILLIQQLHLRRYNIRVFDPVLGYPPPSRVSEAVRGTMCCTLSEMLSWADYIVLTQKPEPKYVEQFMRCMLPHANIIDLTAL